MYIIHLCNTYPIADPHVERVRHADEAEREEDVDGLEEVGVELKVERGREQDGPDQLALGRHEA